MSAEATIFDILSLQQPHPMTKYLLLLSIIFIWGCSRKEKEPVSITIVDIGYIDRAQITKELSIVNKYNPRVIGLDFLLTIDSLEKDVALAEELSRTKNLVQSTCCTTMIGRTLRCGIAWRSATPSFGLESKDSQTSP